MCGICGIYHPKLHRDVEREAVVRMAQTLQHRGPDDEGFFIDGPLGFGHKRLSIIDLSANARQPMCNEDESVWITYNGEIYNYLELRQGLLAKGYRFKSHSDTEVLLKLYEEYDESCVEHLNGMFAFAIWDKLQKKLFAARDRFGVKPFYYFYDGTTFLFASEIKALLVHPAVKPEVNWESLSDYFTFQFCLGEKTLFKNIHKLLPGQFLSLKANGKLIVKEYWDLDFSIDANHTAEYFESTLLRLLEDSVRLQLRADVPVGAHLSGGLDSSTVTALAASLLDAPIHSFSGGFKDSPAFDETKYARLVSAKHATKHWEIFPTGENFIESLPKLIHHMDEPAAGPGLFPQYFVSKLASEHVKVVLGGQGGDEVFGGYMRYLVAYLEECIRGGIEGTQEENKYVVTFESILPNLTQLQGYQPMLQYFWQDGIFSDPGERYFRLIDRSSSVAHLVKPDILKQSKYSPFDHFLDLFNNKDCHSFINKMTRFDQKTLLPALLHVEDRTSMAVSLESRVPLLDHRIAELAAAMPPIIKFKGGRSKHIFRKVVEHIVPKQIYKRKDKMGFPVPLNLWYQKGPVRDFIADILLGETTRTRGFFNVDRIENALQKEQAFGRGIWGLLNIELWLRTFIDHH